MFGTSCLERSAISIDTGIRTVISQIPHGIIIQKIPPRIWLPSMVTVWACLTMCTAACQTYKQLCVVRFLQGLAEGSTFCGTMYIVGSW